jgi:hypothetical protein
MLDLLQLLPHSKKDSKLDTKTDRGVINEVAELKVRSLHAQFAGKCEMRILLMAAK